MLGKSFDIKLHRVGRLTKKKKSPVQFFFFFFQKLTKRAFLFFVIVQSSEFEVAFILFKTKWVLTAISENSHYKSFSLECLQ